MPQDINTGTLSSNVLQIEKQMQKKKQPKKVMATKVFQTCRGRSELNGSMQRDAGKLKVADEKVSSCVKHHHLKHPQSAAFGACV